MKTKTLQLLLLLSPIFAFSQIPNYVPENGLIAFWSFDENTNDTSNNLNHAEGINTTTTQDRFGNNNSAFLFNGVNSKIFVNTLNSNYDFSSFTISAWVKVEGNGTTKPRILAIGPNGSSLQNMALYLLNNNQPTTFGYFSDGSPSDNYVESNYQINDNNWHHIVLVKEANTIKLYLDCSLDNTESITNSVTPFNNGKVQIGYSDNDNDFFNGKLDDIGLWNRALTTQEITNLCNTSLGINEILLNSNSIYPNPSKEFINIDFMNESKRVMKIFNINGLFIKEMSLYKVKNKISIKNLKSGMYFLEITSKNTLNKKVFKFIKL